MTIVRLPERAQTTGDVPLSHVAESVLLIPPTGGGGGPGNAGEASNLATSYADLIPADRAIAQSLARKIGRDPDVVESNISVTNDFNTTIVRLLFSDSYPAVALKGARFLAESVSGPAPVSAQIAPRSLTIVRLPSQVTSQAMGTKSVSCSRSHPRRSSRSRSPPRVGEERPQDRDLETFAPRSIARHRPWSMLRTSRRPRCSTDR